MAGCSRENSSAKTGCDRCIINYTEEDYVKCNIDAAIFGEQRCFGFGMCIRNSRGHFIKALSKWYEGTPPPLEAEALGLRDAILWLGQMGLSKVHIELDCRLMVDSIVDGSIN